MKKHRVLILQITLSLAAVFSSPTSGATEELPVDLKIHPALVNVDWDSANEIVIKLGDDMYEPSEITLKRGQPYKIHLRNIGTNAHDMVGGSLFSEQVIALRMINSKTGRIMADRINSIYLRAKNDNELWFVPLQTGEFTFFCSLPLHRENGMEGIVKVID